MVVSVVTQLADADGIDLTSSAQPSILNDDTVELDVSVDGSHEAVAAAVANISDGLPDGARIEIADD